MVESHGVSGGDTGDGARRGVDRRTLLRSALLGSAAFAAGGLLSACDSGSPSATPGSSSSSKPRRGGELQVGLTGGSSSDTLNPFFGGISAIGTARAQQLYQPLVQLGNDAQLQYVLAEKITPKGSSTSWIIRLRKGITFHDGKPFGADDVIYTLPSSTPRSLWGAPPFSRPSTWRA
jgi:peptide/nickel transport system substrate-binding protein